MLRSHLFASLCACLLLANPAGAGSVNGVVHLETLEWPPYTTNALPGGGMTTSLIRKAFAVMGYELKIDVLPWPSAIDNGLHKSGIDGYFPEYMSTSVRKQCLLSDPTGSSPLVLGKDKTQKMHIRTVRDMLPYRVGVVSGYINTEEFDRNVFIGIQKIAAAESDEMNLRKLIHNRVAMIIIDQNVMHWLLSSNPTLQRHASQLDMILPPLQTHNLYICFKPGSRGEQLLKAYNKGQKTINIKNFTKQYLETNIPGHSG